MADNGSRREPNCFRETVYEIARGIPRGSVLTYGAIAMLASRPNCARLVGRYMSQAPRDLSSHRVVNHAGRTAPGWEEQRLFLEREGVTFLPNGCVDMKRHMACH